MADPVTVFFDAWAMSDATARHETVSRALAPDCVYADPRVEAPLSGVDAISDYVGMFSANAPGWSAKVVKSDEIAGLTRATVAFGGKGPDGSDMVQHGQYFVETDGAKITKMTGFAGTGAPE